MNTDAAMGDLIKLGGNLEDPRNSKATDWPNVGASGPAGESSGAGKLVTQTEAQEGPRHTEDSGENTPSVWGKVEGFTVAKNKGEGGVASTAVKCDWAVDLSSGQTIPNAALDDKY
jgi:hypothetical protein